MEATTRDIYKGREKYCDSAKKKFLEDSSILSKDKELILDFETHLGSRGASKLRRTKLVGQLRKICHISIDLGLQKPIVELSKKELERVVLWINENEKWSQATRSDYRRSIKQFLKWYKTEDPLFYSQDHQTMVERRILYDFIEKDIKTSVKEEKADETIIINEEDIKQLLSLRGITIRDKAFLSLLHESGMRIGEFLNLKMRDITKDKTILKIHVPHGKTGRRRITVFTSVPYVCTWLLNHPDNRPDAYVWISDAQQNRGKPFHYRGAERLIARIFQKAKENGLDDICDKRHNLHWFRHSRATILAPKLTEATLRKYMGWSKDSDMPSRYVHLMDEDLHNTFCEMHGVSKTNTHQTKPKHCSCCHIENPPTAQYCHQCMHPFESSNYINAQPLVDEQIDASIKEMMKVFANEKLRKQFQEFLSRTT